MVRVARYIPVLPQKPCPLRVRAARNTLHILYPDLIPGIKIHLFPASSRFPRILPVYCFWKNWFLRTGALEISSRAPIYKPHPKLFERLATLCTPPSLWRRDSSAVCKFRSVVGNNRGLLVTVIDSHPHLRAKGYYCFTLFLRT